MFSKIKFYSIKSDNLYLQKGFSLVSLMVGIALSSFLLLMIAQLSSIEKQNYIQIQNITGLNENAREAIEFLRQNVRVAGFGITQPVPLATQLESSGIGTGIPTGGYAALRDWVHIGYYADPGPTYQFVQLATSTLSTPQSCASAIANNSKYNNYQFFALRACGECLLTNSANFNKSSLSMSTPATTTATCCSSSGCPPKSLSCGIYNCGGNSDNAVYQRLVQHVCVGINCPNVNVAATQTRGDVLTVYYSNPGPFNFTTFSGSTVTPATFQPSPTLSYYIFYVDYNTSSLIAVDSASGTYTIVDNVEYMAVTLGESDLTSLIQIGSTGNTKQYYLPQMSRYVPFTTSDLYPYRISAVRIALVVRSQDQILPAAPTNTTLNLMLGLNGNWITYQAPSDRYLRRVFVSTIFLDSYTLPQYNTHCVTVGTNNYMKIGGIPFASTWSTNDQCCGIAPCTNYSSFNACETQRMTGGCL